MNKSEIREWFLNEVQTEEDFISLLRSGMLWVYFPESDGSYEQFKIIGSDEDE